MKKRKLDGKRGLGRIAIVLLAGSMAATGGAADSTQKSKTLELEAVGSFSVGGRSVCAPGTFDPTVPGAGSRNAGQCFEIDQLYAQYQIPEDARKLPIVMIHGGAGTGRVWETTPDGREGFQTMFVRRGFPVYVIDAPRGGRARAPTFNGPLGVLSDTENFIPSGTTSSTGSHQAFISWRLGASYPNFFPGSQFPQSGLKQFLQSIIPGIGTNLPVNVASTVALLDRIGPAILFTHSLSGVWGWDVVFQHKNVKGVVTFEGGYVFPPDAMPPSLLNCAGTPIVQGSATTAENFAKLTKIPILVMYGDNQPTCPEPNRIRDGHQLNPIKGQTFVNTLKSHGGKAEFIWLPKIGIFGNTHFIFMDKNNVQIADLVSRFFKKYGLDKDSKNHHRPHH